MLSLLASSSIYCCSIHAQILEPVFSGFQHTVKTSSSSVILQDFVVRLELRWYLNCSLKKSPNFHLLCIRHYCYTTQTLFCKAIQQSLFLYPFHYIRKTWLHKNTLWPPPTILSSHQSNDSHPSLRFFLHVYVSLLHIEVNC